MFTLDLIFNFWMKVDKTPGLGPKGDCWEWTGGTSNKGYGRIKYQGKLLSATRVSFTLANKYEPRQTNDICHECDNPRCVNPKHLFEGSRSDNVLDCVDKGRFVCNSIAIPYETILEIRDLLDRGNRICDLMKIYGISRSHLSAIRNRTVRSRY